MVKDAQDFVKSLLGAETGALLILFGMALILLAVIGAIQGKIDLGRRARIAGGALGVLCLAWGVWLQAHKPQAVEVSPVVPPVSKPVGPAAPSETDSDKSTKQLQPAIEKSASNRLQKPLKSPQDIRSSARKTEADPQLKKTPDKSPAGDTSIAPETRPKTCRIEPKPWRWMTTGRLVIELDGKPIGKVDVGRRQNGFDFTCDPGDHTYRVHSDSIEVACSGGINIPDDSARVDLVFTQAAAGPPECALVAH